MARLTLTDRDDQTLPGICMFCGEAATKLVRRRFSRAPGWVWLFLVAFVVPAFLLAVALTRRATIRVPTCDWHAGAWQRRGWIDTGSLVLVVAFGTLASVVANFLVGNRVGGYVCGGGALLFVGWIVMILILSTSGVRPTRIRRGEITLVGVHPLFVAAYRDGLDAAPLPTTRSQEEADYDDRP